MMKSKIWLFAMALVLLQGCGDDDSPVTCQGASIAEQAAEIDAYATANNLSLTTTTSGLRYVINTPGMGDNAMLGDIIEVSFEGFFLDGTSFGQGVFTPFEFGTVSLIPGFGEGLSLLNEGAQATLILPSQLAYGCFPPQGSIIADNQILIFEVTMVAINP